MHDRDGDGLIDIELAFTDVVSGVDPATIRLTVGGQDVLSEWEVTRRDATGLVAEETVVGLLPAGQVVLGISVADQAGNVRKETLPLDLPVIALHRAIPLPFDPVRRVRISAIALSSSSAVRLLQPTRSLNHTTERR